MYKYSTVLGYHLRRFSALFLFVCIKGDFLFHSDSLCQIYEMSPKDNLTLSFVIGQLDKQKSSYLS